MASARIRKARGGHGEFDRRIERDGRHDERSFGRIPLRRFEQKARHEHRRCDEAHDDPDRAPVIDAGRDSARSEFLPPVGLGNRRLIENAEHRYKRKRHSKQRHNRRRHRRHRRHRKAHKVHDDDKKDCFYAIAGNPIGAWPVQTSMHGAYDTFPKAQLDILR